MSAGTYNQNVTTVTKLIIQQNSVRKKHFFKPVLDKLLYTHRVYFAFLQHFDLKHLLFVLSMPSSRNHIFRNSLLILVLLITFSQTAHIFLYTRNTTTNFKLDWGKVFAVHKRGNVDLHLVYFDVSQVIWTIKTFNWALSLGHNFLSTILLTKK